VVWYRKRGQWQPGRVAVVANRSGARNPMVAVRSLDSTGRTVTVARRANALFTRRPVSRTAR
jgi:hypothetical protein